MSDPWWRRAVIYEVYPRSFADADGDGNGDLAGLLSKLPYLRDLGVDGIWIAPWYPSPMADGGYDVSDFQDVHPMFGDLDAAGAVITEAHALGLRVITDMVANHTSIEHPWFRAALAAAPGSRERARYLFRDGRGPRGDEPPNNWISAFGGSAWTRTTDASGAPGQWYLHTFAEEQPDLDWADEGVRRDFDAILRFWFDRGVDGLRIDAAPALGKAEGLPDADYGGDLRFVTIRWVDNPHWDVDVVHEVFQRFRRVADEYEGDRIFVAEAVVSSAERLAAYLRPDEMQTAFNFPYLKGPWDAGALRTVIDETLEQFVPIGVPPTWVTSSHDETRLRSRYGRQTTASAHFADGQGETVDLALGLRRVRASALLTFALPGTAYLYQGEELALPEVQDLPDAVIQDPVFARTNGETRGRDGCRVPIPWSGDAPPYGFSPEGATTWLPQPAGWGDLTVAAEEADPGSMLRLVRDALTLRRSLPGDDFRWAGEREGVLEFDRGDGFTCVVNISGSSVPIDAARPVLLASADPVAGMLPNDAAVWLGR